MQITNLTANAYDLPGLRLHANETVTFDVARYTGDDRFRLEVNTLVANGKISVASAPIGFPIQTALEAEIARGEIPGAATPGGALPVNWAKITMADPGTPLTVAADTHNFLATEVSIDAQSGTDFSVVDGGGGLAAVVSASGGRFQVGCYLANPDNATLDAGSTLERYLEFAATIGGADDPLTAFGLDTFVPIVPSPRNNPFVMASCCASTIGYAAPGGQVAANLKVFLVGGIGTDSVPLSSGFGFTNFTVYQV